MITLASEVVTGFLLILKVLFFTALSFMGLAPLAKKAAKIFS
jgi:hypothetical protein